ncbi:MAG TPA: aminoacetone oxidase family FAD-binding enzyme [Vicinamibacterales bacterium]|nr:aminoacetone oxidase family FAD-binding enzyme [Vicinamibacterales bacterium]
MRGKFCETARYGTPVAQATGPGHLSRVNICAAASMADRSMRPESCDVAIVGAGAAGLATAIFTRRLNPSCSVVVFDGARAPGAKILVSGGSRCNVTNASVTEHDFWGGPSPIVRRVLRAFTVADTVAFFREIGVRLHEETGGKLFPDTNRARDVLDALLRETRRVGAIVVAGTRVTDLAQAPDGNGFRGVAGDGEVTAARVVLATGGRALPKSGSDGAGYELARRAGHAIVETTPALVPLALAPSDTVHEAVPGVSHDVELAVRVDGAVAIRLAGALLWTHFGVSGPVVLNASRHVLRAEVEGRTVELFANVCPGRGFDAVDAAWQRSAQATPKASVQATLAGLVPASVAAAFLRQLEIDGGVTLAHFSRGERRRLVAALVEWPLPVTGSRGYSYAEATAGGVTLTEIDAGTMASRVCRGLSLVGEILDVDGRIGGFNFQWAWSSGYVAGRALARAFDGRR